MLSHPKGNPQRRLRQHRRQNSTPIALDTAKVPNLPTPAIRQQSIHRRGLSLDQQTSNRCPQQSVEAVTLNTKLGLCQYPPHGLLEAQQRLAQPEHLYFDQSTLSISSSPDCQFFHQGGVDNITNRSSNENTPANACVHSNTFSVDSQNSDSQYLTEALRRIQRQHSEESSVASNNSFDHPILESTAWRFHLNEDRGTIQLIAKTDLVNVRRMSVQSDLNSQIYRPSTPCKQIDSGKQIQRKYCFGAS